MCVYLGDVTVDQFLANCDRYLSDSNENVHDRKKDVETGVKKRKRADRNIPFARPTQKQVGGTHLHVKFI